MFLLTKPRRSDIERFRAGCRDSDLSYPEVGATNAAIPAGYVTDRNAIVLGQGRDVFDRAREAISRWKMFDLGWVEIYDEQTPIAVGEVVAILVRHLGFYSLNAARIVYTIYEPDRFGFAYGTLAEHGEIGEERFMVAHEPETGEVSYQILAFSRPASLAAKLGYPYARYLQKRFAGDSKQAMLRTVSAGAGVLE